MRELLAKLHPLLDQSWHGRPAPGFRDDCAGRPSTTRWSTERQFVDRLLHEHIELTRPYPGITSRLEALAARGTRIVVVTNGTVRQQSATLTHTGLLALVDDVISEAVGAKKPDQRIFATSIERALSIGGAGCTWMVGDHPVADVAGARDWGLQTGWVSHGTAWSADWSPTITACTSVEVLDLLLTATAAQP